MKGKIPLLMDRRDSMLVRAVYPSVKFRNTAEGYAADVSLDTLRAIAREIADGADPATPNDMRLAADLQELVAMHTPERKRKEKTPYVDTRTGQPLTDREVTLRLFEPVKDKEGRMGTHFDRAKNPTSKPKKARFKAGDIITAPWMTRTGKIFHLEWRDGWDNVPGTWAYHIGAWDADAGDFRTARWYNESPDMKKAKAPKKPKPTRLQLMGARMARAGSRGTGAADREDNPLTGMHVRRKRTPAGRYQYAVYDGKKNVSGWKWDSGKMAGIGGITDDQAIAEEMKISAWPLSRATATDREDNPRQRLYYLVAVNNKTGKVTEPLSDPDTHERTMTMKSKFTSHPARRIEVREKNPASWHQKRGGMLADAYAPHPTDWKVVGGRDMVGVITFKTEAEAQRYVENTAKQGERNMIIPPARAQNPDIHVDINSHNTGGRNVRAKNPSTVLASEFHPMRGHVDDGVRVKFGDGYTVTVRNTMRGWTLVSDAGRELIVPTNNANTLASEIQRIDGYHARAKNPVASAFILKVTGKKTGYWTGEGWDTERRAARRFDSMAGAKAAGVQLSAKLPGGYVIEVHGA